MNLDNISPTDPKFKSIVGQSSTIDLYNSTLVLQTQFYGAKLIALLRSNHEWSLSKTILEIGCGPGELAYLLKSSGLLETKNYVGIDLEQAFIESAKRKNAAHKSVIFRQGDVLRDKFGTFDTIIAIAVLQHLGDITLAMRQIGKNLSKNGMMYFLDTGADTNTECSPPVKSLTEMYAHITAHATSGKRNDRCLTELEESAPSLGLSVVSTSNVTLPVEETERDAFIKYSFFASELTKRFYSSPISQDALLEELLYWRENRGTASMVGWKFLIAKNH